MRTTVNLDIDLLAVASRLTGVTERTAPSTRAEGRWARALSSERLHPTRRKMAA